MYRYNFEVDGNYQELVGDMRFQKDELAHLSERMESISNWASKSRHNLEQAYTLGPLVPILLFILYRIIKWISKGFGNSVTSKALQTNETSNSIQDLSAPLNSSIPSANQSEATPSQALLVPPEGKHRNASRVGMRYLLAILACGGIFILYAVIAGLLEWKHGGGAIPIVILLGAIGSTWHAITKKGGDTNSSDK